MPVIGEQQQGSGVQGDQSGQPHRDTGDGFIVGTDPASQGMSPQVAKQVQAETMAGGPSVAGQPITLTEGNTPPQGQSRFFTEEDVARIRQEEKDKVYGRLDEMSTELQTLRQEREAREAAEREEREQLEAERRQQEESEMETRALLERREQEWNQRFDDLQAERERDRAVYEQERRFAELTEYRTQRLSQESEWIMPELRDLVTGNSPEEIDQSIETMKARTASIAQNLRDAQQAQVQGMRGVSPTAPAVGPLESQGQQRAFSPQDIQNMSMDEYMANRQALLAAADPTRMRRV